MLYWFNWSFLIALAVDRRGDSGDILLIMLKIWLINHILSSVERTFMQLLRCTQVLKSKICSWQTQYVSKYKFYMGRKYPDRWMNRIFMNIYQYIYHTTPSASRAKCLKEEGSDPVTSDKVSLSNLSNSQCQLHFSRQLSTRYIQLNAALVPIVQDHSSAPTYTLTNLLSFPLFIAWEFACICS